MTNNILLNDYNKYEQLQNLCQKFKINEKMKKEYKEKERKNYLKFKENLINWENVGYYEE